jgi:hypothetical protein
MGLGTGFPVVAAGFAALAGTTFGAGEAGTGLVRLAVVTGAGLGAGVDVFLEGTGAFLAGGDVFLEGAEAFLAGGDVFLEGAEAFLAGGAFTGADAVAFFLTTGADRAAGADLAGVRVTGFSSQRVHTASARNERRFGTTTMRSLRIAKRGGL